jgi:hypothetical protein
MFDTMNVARSIRELADAIDEIRIPRAVDQAERRRRAAVVRRMRNDPAFAEFTPEAQEQLLRAAVTDDWHAVLPRLPRI